MPAVAKKKIDIENFEAVKRRDAKTLEALVREYSDQLYRAALGAKLSESDARDVVQETFLTFVQTLDRFEGRSKIRTWLFGILFNKINEMRRKLAKRNREDDIEDVLESRFDERGHWARPPKNPEELLDASEIRDALVECMEGLSENHRQAFHLREVQGFPTEEICKILDISVTNLGVILYRARNRLRECLEKKGVERKGRHA